jgi:PAS domain S-box-containing protein
VIALQQQRTTLLIVLQVAILLAVMAAISAYLLRLRSDALEAQIQIAQIQANTLEDHLTQSIYLAQLLQGGLQTTLSGYQSDNRKLGQILEQAQRRLPLIRSLALVNDEGIIVSSSNPANIATTLQSADFTPVTQQFSLPYPRIGPIWVGRDFATGYPLRGDARIGGDEITLLPLLLGIPDQVGYSAILAALNVDYFINHASRHINSEISQVSVIDSAGRLRWSSNPLLSPGSQPLPQQQLQQLWQNEHGQIEQPQGIMVFRASRSYPLMIVVEIERTAALQRWRDEALQTLAIAASALLLLLLLTSRLTWRNHQSRRREEQLRKQLELSATLFNHSTDGVIVTDPQQQIITVNPALTRHTGYTLAEIQGKTPRIFSSGQQDIVFYRRMWQAINQTGVWRGEIVNQRKDGSLITELLTIIAVRDHSGTLLNYLGVFQDISEQRRKDALIRRLSQAVEQSPISIVITDLTPSIEYVNEQFYLTTGFGPSEVIGKNPNLLQSGQTPRATYDEMWATLLRGDRWEGEFVNQRKDGTLYYEHAVIAPLVQADGTITNYVAAKIDTTFRHHQSEQLRLAKEAAEAANIAKSQFLANMSHEIRTPMNGILGMAQLLMMSAPGEPNYQIHLKTLYESGQTLLALLNDILDLSKVESGKIELDRSAVAPLDLLNDLTHLFSESVESKGLTLSWHSATLARRDRVWCDPLRLRQILTNLINNAIKFTAHGGITINVERLPVTSAMTWPQLRFAVSDSGMGIPADKIDRLFKLFSQVDSTITRRFGGTGLGLAIVKGLVDLMAGELGIESVEGQGTTFWFTIALEPVNEAIPFPVTQQAGAPAAIGTHPGKVVLVVEDNRVNRMLAEGLLKKYGYTAYSSEDGQQACDWVMSHPPADLILMDCQMPVMDGLEATRQIREWERRMQITPVPIIAVTANAFDSDRQRCLAAGMNDFITKPIAVAELQRLMERWLSRQDRPE